MLLYVENQAVQLHDHFTLISHSAGLKRSKIVGNGQRMEDKG